MTLPRDIERRIEGALRSLRKLERRMEGASRSLGIMKHRIEGALRSLHRRSVVRGERHAPSLPRSGVAPAVALPLLRITTLREGESRRPDASWSSRSVLRCLESIAGSATTHHRTRAQAGRDNSV